MSRKHYAVEALEPRILLSADPLGDALTSPDVSTQSFSNSELPSIQITADTASSHSSDEEAYQPVESDLFSGLQEGGPEEISETEESVIEADADPSQQSSDDATTDAELLAPAESDPGNDEEALNAEESSASVGSQEPLFLATAGQDQPAASDNMSPDTTHLQNEMTVQLTETLLIANGPPDAESAPNEDSEESSPFGASDSLETTNGSFLSFSAQSPSDPSALEPLTLDRLVVNPDEPFFVPNDLTLTVTDSVEGSGEVYGDVNAEGLVSPGSSPGILNLSGDLTLNAASNLLIEIGGLNPGPGTDTSGSFPVEPDVFTDNDGYDQINVTGNVDLDGTLQVSLLDGFLPSAGQTFDFLTFTGALSGAFDNGVGLFGFGDSTLFFEVIELSNGLQLLVKEAPAGSNITSKTQAINDVIHAHYSDYFSIASSITVNGELSIDRFIHFRGSFDFDVDPSLTVDVATGLPDNAASLLGQFGTEIQDVDMLTLTIGAADVEAFVGLNGPYWIEDLDADGNISWALPDGTTLTNGDGTPQATTTVDGVQYGDLDGDLLVDANETAELSEDATGVTLSNLDLGFAIMKPNPINMANDSLLNAHPRALFYALKATADRFGFIGIEDLALSAENIEINVNNGVEWPGGFGPPVVNFEQSFPGAPVGYEVSTGADPVFLDYNGNQRIGASADTVELQLAEFVHVIGSFSFEKGPTNKVEVATGLPANLGDAVATLISAIDGLIPEAVNQLSDISDAALQTLRDEDFLNSTTAADPLNPTVPELQAIITNWQNAGNLWIETNLSAIHNLEVDSLQIGFSGAHAFVGLQGPYKSDTNSDGSVDDETQVNDDAVGLVIDGADFGFLLAEPTLNALPGFDKILPKFYSLKAVVDEASIVGLEGFLDATLKNVIVEVNNSGGWPGGLGPPVINFVESFPAEPDTGVLADDDLDGDGKRDPIGFEVSTGTSTDPVYLDYDGNQRIGAAADSVELQLAGLVHVIGSFSFEKGPTNKVEIATGLPANLGSAFDTLLGLLDDLVPEVVNQLSDISDAALQTLRDEGFLNSTTAVDPLNPTVLELEPILTAWQDAGNLWIESNLSAIHNMEVDSLQIGFSGAHAFVGLNGPYKSDTDEDGSVADETEINEDAVGLIVDNADFGFLLAEPTLNALPGFSSILPKFYSLKARADLASIVGLEGFLDASLENILIEVNNSGGWPGGLGPPVINFANSFSNHELNNLFDPDGNGIMVDDLIALNGVTEIAGLYEDSSPGPATPGDTVVTLEEIIAALDGATNIDGIMDPNGRLEVEEAALLAGSTAAEAVDDPLNGGDGDGKLDFPGFEVRTGTTTAPVYLDFDGNQRIGAAVDNAVLQLADFVYVQGAFSFEKGPTHIVEVATGLPSDLGTLADAIFDDLIDGILGIVPGAVTLASDLSADAEQMLRDANFLTATTPTAADINAAIALWQGAGNVWIDSNLSTIHNLEVDSFQIGANDVHAFLGVNGPYWEDTNGDRVLDTDEIREEAIGLVVDDLDAGFLLSQPTLASLPGLDKILPKFYALKGSAELISFVGIDEITMDLEGVEFNVNDGKPWPGDLGPPVINFENSFATDELSELFGANNNVVTVADLKALNGVNVVTGLYDGDTPGDTVVTLEEIIAALDGATSVSGLTEPNGQLEVEEAAIIVGNTAALAADDSVVSGADTIAGDEDGKIEPAGFEVRTGVTTPPVYLDFDGNQRLGALVEKVTIQLSQFVHITGSVAFEKGPVRTVALADGAFTGTIDELTDAFFTAFGVPTDTPIPILGQTEKEVAFMTIGASNVNAFVGLDGPYWVADLDGDNNISWALPDDMTFDSDVTIGGVPFAQGDSTTGVTLTASDGTPLATSGPVLVNGVEYGDLANFGEVDANETAELNEEAIGLVVDDFDFGLSIMTPTNPFDFAKYYALRASAKQIALKGIDDVTLEANEVLVEVNQSNPSVYGISLFQVVDFANTPEFASEELALFDTTDSNHLGIITLGELSTQPGAANVTLPGGITPLSDVDSTDTTVVDHEFLLALLDTNNNDIIENAEAAVLTDDLAVVELIDEPDDAGTGDMVGDGDGKLDPLGFEVETGGQPVYLTMDTPIVKAQGFLEMDVFGVVTLIGSFAFELGPLEDVVIVDTDGTTRTDTVTTMTIGAANVFGFVGWDGPYFLDGNNNKDIDLDQNGDPLPGEVSSSAKGIALNELNLGVFVAVSTSLTTPGGYFAMDFSVDSIEIVGLDFLSANATLAMRLNLGLSLNPGEVIDFAASFQQDLNLDNDFDDENEMGFLVNTGDPDSPVLIDFTGFLINIEIGGTLTISAGGTPLVEMLGVFFLETDLSSFKLFATAAILAGPDIGQPDSDSSILKIEALGVVIINSDGFAADFDVDFDFNLPSLALPDVSARVIINTTGKEQELEIPTRLIDFINDASANGNSLADALLDRLETCDSGSGLCYKISEFAPDITVEATVENLLSGTGVITFTTATSYVVAVIDAEFDFVGFALASGTAGIVVSPTLFQLYANLGFEIGVQGIDLDFEIEGILEVSAAGLFLDVEVSLDVDLTSLLTLDVGGNLVIDTRGSNNFFRLSMNGDLTIARVLTVNGSFTIEVGAGGPNTWRLDMNLGGDLGPIELTAGGFIQSDGQFEITIGGRLEFGIDGFKISGGVSGTVKLEKSGTNFVFSNSDVYTLTVLVSGDVTLTIIGIDIGASVTLGGSAAFSSDGTVLKLHAEGCVDLWLDEVCAGGTIAEIAIPASIFPEPPPNLATIVNTDELRLNVGANRGSRNVATTTTAESYQLTDLGGGRVRVEAFGYTEIYTGVSSVTADFGSDNDILILTDGFNLMTTANGEAGNDILTTSGLGVVVFDGGANDDLLVGGTAADTLIGGTGNDYLDGRGSGDILSGGANDDVVFGVINDLLGDTATGGSGTDTIEVRGTNNADAFTLSESNGSLEVTVTGIGTVTADGFENVVVAPGNSADTVTIVGNLNPSGIDNFTVSLGEDTPSADIVDATLLSTDDNLSFSGAIAPAIRTNQRSAATVPSTATPPNVPTSTAIWAEGHNSVISATDALDQVLIDSLEGADNILIPSLIANTEFNTGSGADRMAVGSNATTTTNSGGTVDSIGNSSQSVVASLEIIGGADPDVLSIDDSGDGNSQSGILTATRLTGLGMNGMIDYSEIETLNIDLGSDMDTFTIESTHTGVTNLNTHNGGDIVNIRAVAGTTTVNTGRGNDTVNVGSNAQGNSSDRDNNTNGTLNAISSLLVIVGGESTSDDDLLTLDDTADTQDNTGVLTSSRVTGLGMGNPDQSVVDPALGIDYTELEELVISLGTGADTFTIESTHSGITELNGEDGADTVNVNGTSANSSTTINGESGNDIINVRAMNGAVTVNGNANNDTVNVGSTAPVLPSLPTTQEGHVDDINALLIVDGGNGTQDVLNVDDSNPTNTAKSGMLTSSTIRGLDLEEGIDYTTFEELTLWLAFGNNTLTINSTHSGETTVNTAAGDDTVHVNDASGVLTVNAEADADTVNVRATSLGSQTFINGEGGSDTINLSDTSPTLPALFPASLPPPAADTVGNIDGIDGLIDIDGGAETDVLNIDDSANTNNKAGTLSSTTLRGLDLPAGVNYLALEDLNLWLGSGADVLFLDSTHAGTTQVYAGDGNATVNERDDTIALKSTGGVTTIHAQAGNDFVEVNVDATTLPQDNTSTAIEDLFVRTHLNGLGSELFLHGEGDSDQVTLNFAGEGEALVHVHDNGAPDNGVDTLIVNGADVVSGLSNQPNDTFLLRRDIVALLNDSDNDQVFDRVERANYDENINARLVVNGLGGEDHFVADDNSSITTLDGGDDDDSFQIGQVFGSLRDANANIAPGDTFDTTPVIIGVIRDPNTNDVLFNPAEDDLDAAAIAAIEAAIAVATSQGLPLDGIAYLSNGVTHPTTVYGGDGEDKFSVYHNKGVLRLEGEADNDEFIVRAFVILSGAPQGDTEVNGGAGNDLIQYAINAPVNIDGGEGFDKVVVLGTPFPDDFVVREDGIFGAGLNVKFDNVESAELDTLEGDDTVYVLSTSKELITTVIGGLGSDTVNVLGDVVTTIISNDLLGRSGVITHDLESTDPLFTDVGVDGVNTNILSAEDGALVAISATGDALLVSEEGLIASYTINLTSPLTSNFATVYLTVSAGISSSKDQSEDGESILVSNSMSGPFTHAVVLTFTQANTKQTIYVKAIDDVGLEGERTALVSHSINSESASYNDLALIDVFVDIVDNDQPSLDIRTFEDVNGTLETDNITEVLEGADGLTDVYQFALTRAPDAGETVTVTLLHDTEITLSQTLFTFDTTDWDTFRTVTITAVDDSDQDGTELSTITHRITSDGSVFDIPAEDYPTLEVAVLDDETGGVLVRESEGSTVVAEGGDNDSYRVRLTRAPTATVTLTLLTDKQTQLTASSSRFSVISEDDALSNFEYELTFDDTNWSDWFEVTVTANPDFQGTATFAKPFAPKSQNLDKIAGPLVIEAGTLEGTDRSLAEAVVLPGEINVPSGKEDPITEESEHIDTLNIFHADNTDPDSGSLLFRDDTTGIDNTGHALTGFDMGGDLTVNQGTPSAPNLVTFGGGITYANFEIAEVLLGKGNETLDISATTDEAITAVHGGGGDDTVTVTDRGAGPLVIYGDTSEDGIRYSNDTGAASEHATSFSNPGNDIINASGLLDQADSYVGIVIYGGPGNDTLTGSQDDDHLAGGAGDDNINGEAGVDHIYGDSHFNVNLPLFAQDRITPFDENVPSELDQIHAMFTVPTTGLGGSDTIHGGLDNDMVLGDHGIIDQVDGTRRIQTTGSVNQIQTANIGNGADDTIHGDEGNDFVFGGTAGDTLFGDLGSDLIFGDHGTIAGTVDGDAIGEVDGAGVTNTSATFLYTSDISAEADASAGADTLYGGSLAVLDTDTGKNILLGQQDEDTIYGGGSDDNIYGGHNVANGTDTGDFIDGGAGNDVILGDNGLIERTAGAQDRRFAVLQGDLIYNDSGLLQIDVSVLGANPASIEARRIELFDHDDSANNVTNFGDDTIAGGADDDLIFGELGNDQLHGDGQLMDVSGALELVALTATLAQSDVGGDDYVEGNGGDDTIYGGLGQDDLIGGSSSLYSLDDSSKRPDGSDTIFGGNGDMIARNEIGDESEIGHARDADYILGDNGNLYRLVGTNSVDSGSFLTFNYDTYTDSLPVDEQIKIIPRGIEFLDYTFGGDPSDIGASDLVRGGTGDDVIHGMVENDVLYGDGRDDDIFGGTGHDRIFGGSGVDGIVADDGTLLTSRNGLTESLYGLTTANQESSIDIPGPFTGAVVNIGGLLKKDVNLLAWEIGGHDIVYGGLGDDWIHAGAGDDAVSGAEALAEFYDDVSPQTSTPPIAYDPTTRKLEFYDADNPRLKIDGFLLNFEATDGSGVKIEDGKDRIFGDLGHDWLVGGTGYDRLFGGLGDDLMNADDNHDNGTTPGLNDQPDDPEFADGDFVFGGNGLDVLIVNSGNDRMYDWKGEFNSYFVPFSPFGNPTVVRSPSPQIRQFLEDLGAASGADQSLVEPDGELGLSSEGDTGGPRDPQPGNIGGVARDTQGGPEDDSTKILTADGSTPGNDEGGNTGGGTTAPTIDSLSGSPDPVTLGQDITLTASGVADTNGTVSSVAFYRDTDGSETLDAGTDDLLGTDSDGTDGWSFTTSTAGFPAGSQTYFAQATDNDNLVSAEASAAGEISGGNTTTTTYASTDGAVTLTDRATTNVTIDITDSFSILDINVQLDISHTRDGDMEIFLISASGLRVELFTDVGGNQDNFTNTILDDEASTSITSGSAPFTGSFQPEGDLSLFQGENTAGTWTLEVTDDRNKRTGTLNSWSLIVEH